MPLWYHNALSAKTNRITNSKHGRCLRNNHKIYIIGDAINITNNQPANHKISGKKCKCIKCKEERHKGCTNPAKCLSTVKKLLNELPVHWKQQNDNGYETEETLDKESQENNNDSIKTFEYQLPTSNDIYNALRIFTTAEDNLKDIPKPRNTENNIITVYTNGTCKLNGDVNAQAGSGIWINKDSTINKACRVPGLNQNTETGKLYATEYTACKIPKDVQLKIESKSKYMINAITSSLPYYEDKGWIGVQNAHEIKRTVAWLRQRGSNTLFKWVDDHTNNAGNKEANQQAIKGQKETNSPKINLRTPIQLNLQGVKLSSLTQATAYKAIRQKTIIKERKSTMINLDITRYAANDLSGHTPTDSQIWLSIRSKDITRTIRNFLWMMLHNAYKCGKYWDNIPNYAHRAMCLKCNAEESLEHILIDCRQIPTQNTIWKLCEQLWENTGNQWPQITYGKILACGLAQFRNKNNQILHGKNRLYRILISESAFLIWKLHCKQRIAK